jgi:integrase/recombinase XerD
MPFDFTIQVKRLHHRDTDNLALFFPIDSSLTACARSINGVRFSVTHKCWYVPERPHLLGEIFAAFKGIAWVDITLIKNTANAPAEPEAAPVVAAPPRILPATTTSDLAQIVGGRKRTSQPGKLTDIQAQALRMMEQKLNLRAYSPNTVRTYLQAFKEFMLFYVDEDPQILTEFEIRNYVLYLIEQRKLSRSTQNQAINAIKFFYEKMLLQPRKTYYLDRPMKEHRLPEVLSTEEVMRIFEALDNLKHRVMLMLLYSAGLRRSELINLRIGDVDLHRYMVLIRGGKGRKDRQTVVAQNLVPILEQYILQYNPKFWLFEGVQGDRYSASSLQQVLKQAVQRAGIKKRVRLHMLRHSFATHLLESGTSTRYIQILLGHESPKTTEIYAQVTRFALENIESPLDKIVQKRQLRDPDGTGTNEAKPQ